MKEIGYALFAVAVFLTAIRILKIIKIGIPDFNLKWSIPVQAAAAVTIVTIISLFVFQKEVTVLWAGNKSMIIVIIAAAMGMFIGGNSLTTVFVCRKIALIVLIVTIAYFGAKPKWFSPANPSANLSSAAAQSQISARAAGFNTELPAGAEKAGTLAPGGIIYLIREDMSAPPPERWLRYPNGAVLQIKTPWPDGEKIRYVDNFKNSCPLEVFYVGQSIRASDTPPEPETKLAGISATSEGGHLLPNIVN